MFVKRSNCSQANGDIGVNKSSGIKSGIPGPVFTFLLLIFITASLFAGERKGLIRAGFVPKAFSGTDLVMAGEFSVIFFYTDRLSAKFLIAGGKNYMEISPSIVLAPIGYLLVEHTDESAGKITGYMFLGLSLLENLSFHVDVGNNFEFVPTIGLIRTHVGFFNNRYIPTSGANLGFELNGYAGEHFCYGFFSEVHILYHESIPVGGSFGVRAGFQF